VNNNYNSNTVIKQDFAVVKQVDGRAAHMTDTTRHQSWQSTPLPDHAGSIPELTDQPINPSNHEKINSKENHNS
jgi:hypothetical protein